MGVYLVWIQQLSAGLVGAGIGLIYQAETQECCYVCVMLYRIFRIATNAISFVRTLRRFTSRLAYLHQSSISDVATSY